MPRVLNFYMDDSGTRMPNRKPLTFTPGKPEFFALGGILIDESKEAVARAAYTEFCDRWSIQYPLHSVEIRHSAQKFSWLRRGTEEYEKFMRDLTRLLKNLDVLGLACAIDRPGYDARYREKYGRRQWHLCQTAFFIVVERAAKYARDNGYRLRVMPERSSRDDERRIKQYFQGMKKNGSPFDQKSSAEYAPLTAAEFDETLYELRFKSKLSPMAQIADLFVWPMAIAGYQKDYRAHTALKEAGRFLESQLGEKQWATRGTKYSCFELVQNHKRLP